MIRPIAVASNVAHTREAYERWAPSYPPVAHNPLMRAEQRAMLDLWPEVRHRCALDVACGSGRYSRLLADHGAADVIAVDFSTSMLRSAGSQRVCADMMSLPFRDRAFDVLISGLAVGHAPSLEAWMLEAARVLKPGSSLLYSDFHPAAARAGLPRSFKDQDGRTVTVPHRAYDVHAQVAAAEIAGLRVDAVREIRVGIDLTEPFSNSESFYRQWHGLPVVLVVRAHK